MLAVGISAILLSYLTTYVAGRTKGVIWFLLSTVLILVSIVIFAIQFFSYENDRTDQCSKHGGHYVLDERVRNNNGPALDLYKCVRD